MAKPTPIKLLLVSPLPPPPGGIATWSSLLLSELAKCQDIQVSHVDTALRWRTIITRSLAWRIFTGICQACWDGMRVMWRLLTFRPHVMHLTTSARLGLAKDLVFLLMARLLRVRSVLHIHDPRLGQIEDHQKWQMRLTTFAIRFADRVIVLDRKSYDTLVNRLPKIHVCQIPNMVSLDEMDTIIGGETENPALKGDSVFRIVFIGRITPEKGIEELVEACTKLEGVHLHCVGPIEDQCQQRIVRCARLRTAGNWLNLHGHVAREEVLRQLQQCNLFVLPSRTEAFPLSILEAMALSKAVVATNVGAVQEMIEPEDAPACGLCVEKENIEALRNAISVMMQSPRLRAELGSNGRSRVEKLYSTSPVLSQLMAQWFG